MNRKRLIALTLGFLVLVSLFVSCLGMGSTHHVGVFPEAPMVVAPVPSVEPLPAPMAVAPVPVEAASPVPVSVAPTPIEAPVVYLP